MDPVDGWDEEDAHPSVSSRPIVPMGEPEDEGELVHRLALARMRAGLLGLTDNPVAVGRYQIEDRIGQGAMGVVYTGRDAQLGRKVAIKLLHGDLSKSQGGKSRLLREAQAMAKLSHPNVVHVYEVGYHEDTLFVAMEFIDGRTLRRWGYIDRTWEELLRMHILAGRGLAAAHQAGLIHRDYKPDNVLVGEDDRPRVLDFGLARPENDVASMHDEESEPSASEATLDPDNQDIDITATGTVLGTPAYMSPEQLQAGDVDARADQYSFCVALFEALYGTRPFPGSNLSELFDAVLSQEPIDVGDAPDVPRSLRSVLLRGLARDRRKRFATMTDLLDALEHQLEPRPARPWLRWVGAGVVGTGFVTAMGLSLLDRDPPAPEEPVAVEQPSSDAAPQSRDSVIAASNLPEPIDEPLPDDPTQTTVHRLDNGLTIYITPGGHETVVRARLVVRADYRDERPGEEGLSTLSLAVAQAGSAKLGSLDYEVEQPLLAAEHALIAEYGAATDESERAELFGAIVEAEQRAAEYSRPDFDQTLDEIGAESITTWYGTHSVLASAVLRNRIEAWLKLHAEAVRRPVFRRFLTSTVWARDQSKELAWTPAEFRALTREVASNSASREVAAMAENLAELPLAKTRAFYERYYRPNNVALVFVGDISATEVLPAVEAAFGDWEPAPIPTPELKPVDSTSGDEPVVVGGGSARVAIAWHAPDSPEEQALLHSMTTILGGEAGLLSSLGLEGNAGSVAVNLKAGTLIVTVGVPDGETHDATAERVIAAMKAVADHSIDDAIWNAAEGQRRFMASGWAGSSEALADSIANSFSIRRPWTSMAQAFIDREVPRADLEAVAATLLARSPIVIHVVPGATEEFEPQPLPVPSPRAPKDFRVGTFARSLIAQSTTPPEPQFLVAGRNFEKKPFGAGLFVSVERPGPRFEVTMFYGAGVRDDPWACIAVRAKTEAAIRARTMTGVAIQPLCGRDETRLIIEGLNSDFDRVWPVAREWLARTEVNDADAQEVFEDLLASRDDMSLSGFARVEAVKLHALTLGNGVAAHMPSFSEVEVASAERLQEALVYLQSAPLDVGYVGPRPADLERMLPTPRLQARTPVEPERPTPSSKPQIFVSHLEGATDVEVWFSVRVLPNATVREQLLGRILLQGPPNPGPDGARGRMTTEAQYLDTGVRAPRRELKTYGFLAPYDELSLALDRGLRTARRVPVPTKLEGLRRTTEGVLRQDRVAQGKIPEIVLDWQRRGVDADPLIQEWLALPAVTHDELAAFAERVQAIPPLITVVGDKSRLDTALLERTGDVTWVDADLVLREPSLDEGVFFGLYQRSNHVFE